MKRELTKEERSAVKSLERLAKRWPSSLALFSWSGSLQVVFTDFDPENMKEYLITSIHGIPNEGGDPEFQEYK